MSAFSRITVVLMCSVVGIAGSQSPLVYQDFRNTTGLTLFGSASQTGTENEIVTLTSSSFEQLGAVFTEEMVNVEAFHVSFRVRISQEATGAPDCNGEIGGDGISFIIGRDQSLGAMGGGLGFRGLNNSVAVVVDTYCNSNFNDPASSFIAIHTDGNVNHTANTPFVSVGDDRDLYVWVDYRGGTLFVRYNTENVYPKEAAIQQAIDIPGKMNGLKGFMGIVGATGGGIQRNELLSWTYHPPVPTIQYFKPDWFFVQKGSVVSEGRFLVNFDQVNPDGVIVPGNDRLGYDFLLELDGQIVAGLAVFPTPGRAGTLSVPQIKPPFDNSYQIRVARIFESNRGARSEDYVVDINPDQPNTTPQSHLDYDRWLLHVPKRGSGFSTIIKCTNHLNRPTRVFLQGYNDQSRQLGSTVLTIPANGTAYFSTYDDVFTSSLQDISHIAISDQTGFVDVEMEYFSTSTGYSAWTHAIDFRDGDHAGSRLEMDASSPAFLDGVAIANMRNLEPINLYVVQYDRNTRAVLGESYQGILAPGEKRALIVSSLFTHRPNTVYTFETRNQNHFLTALGLSFNGFEFFSTKPVRPR